MNSKVSCLIVLGCTFASLIADDDVKKRDIPLTSYGIGSSSNSYSSNNAGSNSFQSNRPYIKILSSNYNAPGTLDGSSNFDHAFESENGIRQQAVGKTKVVGETEVVVMKGSYEYVGPNGQTYVVEWYADETGYHPSGPHLPKDVPIPYPEIANAVSAQISFAAANPNDYDDGSYTGNNINNIVYDNRPISNYGYDK
ncbi:endocuticle structural glycoprotein SgAbd-8-like [Lepeophtheirus salmonis]|uniref:endocuticle structural glycoprotein SgAbd-8-like n=1 Tax=Lepeophtheirus salmonis TaxID=72036 RepID=UPI001AE9EBCC|nr:pupal cuticle protein 20-like [Lepeophtheirus salmonis]